MPPQSFVGSVKVLQFERAKKKEERKFQLNCHEIPEKNDKRKAGNFHRGARSASENEMRGKIRLMNF